MCGVHAHSDTLSVCLFDLDGMPAAFYLCIVCMLSKLNVMWEKDVGL